MERKLKYVNLDGYEALILVNDKISENSFMAGSGDIVFADPELNLDVPPMLNWREWELEQLAEEKYPIGKGGSMWMPSAHNCNQANKQEGFIAGYNHKKAKYTEEDLRKAIEMSRDVAKELNGDGCYMFEESEIIQSLQKHPQYIIMQDNQIKEIIY